VWSTTTPGTSPDLAGIGTATIELEPFLVDLGHVLHARIRHRVVADERRRAVTRDPPREAVVQVELDPSDHVGVNLRRRAQNELRALAQVHEAGVAIGRLGQQIHDRREQPVQIGADATTATTRWSVSLSRRTRSSWAARSCW
jgi:hypothetical protein